MGQPSHAEPPVRPGDVLAGKYRVERVLGSGGMGVVVAATHLQLGTQVAIKFLLPSARGSTEAPERFLREARAAARIESDHVVRVTDVATLESGAPYMVMELLRGTDLAARAREHGPFEVEDAVNYVLQACEAIAQAHAMGIVHRDLKPSNLFLVEKADGSSFIKVLDFGISKALEGASAELAVGGTTDTFWSAGSPLYMSPEQLRSAKNVDRRTDIWSLGVVLYELLAGRPPFVAESFTALCLAIANDPPVPLRERRPEVPVALEAVVMRCLEKDVARRTPTVAALAQGIGPFATAEARLSVDRVNRMAVPASGEEEVSELASTVAAPSDPGAGTTSRRGTTKGARKIGWGLPLLAATVIGFGAALLLASRRGPEVERSQTPVPIASVQPTWPPEAVPASASVPPPVANAAPEAGPTSSATATTVSRTPSPSPRPRATTRATGTAPSAARNGMEDRN